MGMLRHWARVSNERAVDNARAAAAECSRRHVEREEVELVLAGLRHDREPARHPA